MTNDAPRHARPAAAAVFFFAVAGGCAAGALHDTVVDAGFPRWLWLFAIMGAVLVAVLIRRRRARRDNGHESAVGTPALGSVAGGLGLLLLALPNSVSASLAAAVAGGSLTASVHFVRESRLRRRDAT